MEKMTHEEYVNLQRGRVVEIAQKALNRELDILDAAAQIVALAPEIEAPENDSDIEAFVLIRSETETLPFGKEAENWASEAIERKAIELMKAREWAWQTGAAQLENLIRRFRSV